MNLYENKQLMKELNKELNSDVLYDVRLFEKQKKNYNISIFVVETLNSSQLAKDWLEISESIAYTYQSEYLKKSIEIWNVYIFFLVKEELSLDLKYTIENNKFSSRKFVMKYKSQSVKEVIDSKLFSLSYKKEKERLSNNIAKDIREFIKTKDKELLEALFSEEKKSVYINNLMEETNGF